ncbi:hypothetical protein [Desulfogranum marinum]|uniref:hypothetical protein n=1 Tax=Desulfogranum marinum TaxID=453220 RepID=UPI001963B246|nr:hypothetical protein [Desulfogranum marinum]MBM9512328.1 hypothetical protein [Desulfogranum marinum]
MMQWCIRDRRKSAFICIGGSATSQPFHKVSMVVTPTVDEQKDTIPQGSMVKH